MTSFIARILIYLVLGWIIYEITVECNKVFSLSLNPYLGIIPVPFIFILQEYHIRKWPIREKSVSSDRPVEPKKRDLFSIILWSLAVCFLLGIVLIVFLGIIYKQGSQGLDLYHYKPK
jgi:hypothetical protein